MADIVRLNWVSVVFLRAIGSPRRSLDASSALGRRVGRFCAGARTNRRRAGVAADTVRLNR
eukprot:1104143-Lingulodinium_polyedra.AAC.1